MKSYLCVYNFRCFLVACLAALMLAACSSGSVRPSAEEMAAMGPFDMIVQAFDSGQFIVGGGVVAPVDLEGHFAYLQSQGEMPAKVLLESSSEEKVGGNHLRELSRLQAKFGFEAFVEHDGKIERLHEDE